MPFLAYQQPVSIADYLAGERVQRRRTNWQPEYYYLGESFLLDSIGLGLNVLELYERLENLEIREFLLQHPEANIRKW